MLARIWAALRQEVCPYCFQTFKLKDAPFRCASPPQRCSPELDQVRREKWEDAAPLGRVLLADGRFKTVCICPGCDEPSSKRLCPHCHMDLPHTTGRFRNYIFAVIGAKEAGKSHFLAVLIHQIRKHVGPDMNLLLEALDDNTTRRYRQEFHDPLFRDNTVIRGTVSALADQKVRMPLVYSLAFIGRGMLGKERIRNVVTLVFFDTAGEDLDDEDKMSAVNRYIYRSDGIILLLDPLQLDRVRDRLGSSTGLPSRNTETSDIVTRTTRLILRGRGLQLDSMVKTPIAVTFSKLDAVDPLLDSQLQLRSDSRHGTGFDVCDFEAVNAEMQALLQGWEGSEILNQVRSRYQEFGFFGISALGCNPHGSNEVPRVFPHRIEDPFLWLLYRQGLIRATKRS